MSSYDEKLAARKARYLELADSNREKSNAEFKKADLSEGATGIPFGQPILVGHHSEGRHRRTIDRADKAMRRSIEADAKADHYERKAAGVGKGGISSDDPEAVTKLQAKIDAGKALQAFMKAANKIVRRKGDSNSKVAALVQLGMTDAEALKLLTPDFCNRYGFAPYMLANNNANIKRMEERIEQLQEMPTTRQEYFYGESEVVVVVDPSINRTQLRFPAKPPEDVRTLLKAHGFRWAPSQGAWQRHISKQAFYWANIIAMQYDPA
jgi:hypothetical protein